MTSTAKKERNRAYYLKNRERILGKARDRKGHKGQHLCIVGEAKNAAIDPRDSAFFQNAQRHESARPKTETISAIRYHDSEIVLDLSGQFQMGERTMERKHERDLDATRSSAKYSNV